MANFAASSSSAASVSVFVAKHNWHFNINLSCKLNEIQSASSTDTLTMRLYKFSCISFFMFHSLAVGQMELRERVVNLASNVTGYLFQLNYPHDMPENVDYTQHLLAPFGDNILLELHGVEFSDNGCEDNNILEVSEPCCSPL